MKSLLLIDKKEETNMKPSPVVYLISAVAIWNVVCASNECKTPQYIQIGSRGIIQCSFRINTLSVLWYKLTNGSRLDTLVTMVNSVKAGEGYLSGEYDVYPNGSLVIQDSLMKNEGEYRVDVVDNPSSTPKPHFVTVFVLAQTFTRIPAIDNCENKSEVCLQMLDSTTVISCTVRDARTVISLGWIHRTGDIDRNASSHLSIRNEMHPFFTSRVTLSDAFIFERALTLLICKANDQSGLLYRTEALTLIQKSDESLLKHTPKPVFARKNFKLELNCNNISISYLVWQIKRRDETVFKTLFHAVLAENYVNNPFNDDFELTKQFSIVVDYVTSRQEGTYRCMGSNAFEDAVNMYEVVMFVYPDPTYPVVDGCSNQQYCVLEAHPEGTLTCSVRGIRPQVELDIEEVFNRSPKTLQFYDKTSTIEIHGDTFDVTIMSKYRLHSVTASRLTVECKVVGTNIKELHLSTKFDLLFRHVQSTDETKIPPKRHFLWTLMVVILLCLVVIVVWRLHVVRGRKMRNTLQQEEGTHMTSSVTTQVESDYDPKGIFVRELKTKYKIQYDAVQPIPYIKDRLYCVDRVFVEGGFEKLISTGKIEGLGNWWKLASYYDVTNLSPSSSTRTIIEGDPGYGKSTLTLQLAYDWCNRNPTSPLADLDILILLRLRQLGGVHSIFRAIKQFILPRDSQLEEADIQNIIKQSKSTLFIFDGFDEYPDQEIEDLNDVISTVKGDMFQENFVVLTSRSFFLPKTFPPQTHRIRLTGFDSKARDAYIRKAVAGDNTKAVEKIKTSLQKNSVLQGLCQVPLFFVMFAHMTHESERFLKFKSVTSFFKYMINCFHSHMKNKMKDVNVKKIDLHENDHAKLDEVAFLGLSGKNQQIVWMKEDLVQRLGKDFYHQYRAIGILVEDEILDMTDNLGEIRYKREVRFYHKLFCEWYAAHYLSREVMKHDTLQTLLQYMSPFDLQYTYRFACGLNPDAGNRIIEYLRSAKDGDKFVVLCILEQSGNFDKIKKAIKDMCSTNITIDNADSLLLQGSVVQLLEIASNNQISISCVHLNNCYSTVDLRGGNHLQLKSNLSIPVLTTLNELVIDTEDEGREITSEEFTGILQYSSKCLALKKLLLGGYLLPPSVQAESVSVLRSRNVKVFWYAPVKGFQLNLQSGQWERTTIYGRGLMTDEEYQEEVIILRERWGK